MGPCASDVYCTVDGQLVTACNSSCGKVMFSQASVIPSVHRGIRGHMPRWDVCTQGGLHLRERGLHPGGDLHQPSRVSAYRGVCIVGVGGLGRLPEDIMGYYRIQSTSGRYAASYWNATLLTLSSIMLKSVNVFVLNGCPNQTLHKQDMLFNILL